MSPPTPEITPPPGITISSTATGSRLTICKTYWSGLLLLILAALFAHAMSSALPQVAQNVSEIRAGADTLRLAIPILLSLLFTAAIPLMLLLSTFLLFGKTIIETGNGQSTITRAIGPIRRTRHFTLQGPNPARIQERSPTSRSSATLIAIRQPNGKELFFMVYDEKTATHITAWLNANSQ